MEITTSVDSVVLPGDIIGRLRSNNNDESKVVRLGVGLLQNKDDSVANKCGVLRQPTPNYYYVENRQKRVQSATHLCTHPEEHTLTRTNTNSTPIQYE